MYCSTVYLRHASPLQLAVQHTLTTMWRTRDATGRRPRFWALTIITCVPEILELSLSFARLKCPIHKESANDLPNDRRLFSLLRLWKPPLYIWYSTYSTTTCSKWWIWRGHHAVVSLSLSLFEWVKRPAVLFYVILSFLFSACTYVRVRTHTCLLSFLLALALRPSNICLGRA